MNKKLVFVYFFLVNILALCFSEDLTGKYYSEEGYFYFVGNQYVSLKIDMDGGTTKKNSGKFKLLEDSFGNKIICFINENQQKEVVRYFCFDDYLFLYKDSEIPFFIGNITSAQKIESLVSTEVSASSFLTESNHNYSPSRITFWGNLNYVWAEGVTGQGIGEKLFLNANAISKLYILPGYVSIKRPDLFKENSRPKKIKVSTQSKVLYFSLIDKPVFQVLDFNSIIREKITIEILEVYPGTKFEDTCISAILCSR